jgi:hypothetical protein
MQTKKTLSQMSGQEAWAEFCRQYNEKPIVKVNNQIRAEFMAKDITSKSI